MKISELIEYLKVREQMSPNLEVGYWRNGYWHTLDKSNFGLIQNFPARNPTEWSSEPPYNTLVLWL